MILQKKDIEINYVWVWVYLFTILAFQLRSHFAIYFQYLFFNKIGSFLFQIHISYWNKTQNRFFGTLRESWCQMRFFIVAKIIPWLFFSHIALAVSEEIGFNNSYKLCCFSLYKNLFISIFGNFVSCTFNYLTLLDLADSPLLNFNSFYLDSI